jgi:hypothetical protein
MSSSLKLELTVSGQVGQFPFDPVTATYEVTGQEVATGPKAVRVPAGTPAGTLEVCLEPMAEQNVLLIFSDKLVTFQVNENGVDQEINAGAFAIYPGDPVATKLAFGNAGTQAASITVFQLGLQGTPPAAGLPVVVASGLVANNTNPGTVFTATVGKRYVVAALIDDGSTVFVAADPATQVLTALADDGPQVVGTTTGTVAAREDRDVKFLVNRTLNVAERIVNLVLASGGDSFTLNFESDGTVNVAHVDGGTGSSGIYVIWEV